LITQLEERLVCLEVNQCLEAKLPRGDSLLVRIARIKVRKARIGPDQPELPQPLISELEVTDVYAAVHTFATPHTRLLALFFIREGPVGNVMEDEVHRGPDKDDGGGF
jgi:hypothetical protein